MGLVYQFYKNNSYFSKSLSMIWRLWLLRFLGVTYTESFYTNFVGRIDMVYKMDIFNAMKSFKEKIKKEVGHRFLIELNDTSLLENAGGLITILLIWWIIYFIYHYGKVNRMVQATVKEIEDA